MKAIDFEVGKKFVNIHTEKVLIVIEEDGVRYFETTDGDLHKWIDEDVYICLEYENDEDLYV